MLEAVYQLRGEAGERQVRDCQMAFVQGNGGVMSEDRRCSSFIYYPRPFCPRCPGDELEWREASGRGRVYTYTVVRRAATPAFADRVPHVLALVELEEGPRVVTNIVGCRPEEVRIGMPVRAAFERHSGEVGLVIFQPEAELRDG